MNEEEASTLANALEWDTGIFSGNYQSKYRSQN